MGKIQDGRHFPMSKYKIYGLEIHPELTFTSRLSDQADTPFSTKTRYPKITFPVT